MGVDGWYVGFEEEGRAEGHAEGCAVITWVGDADGITVGLNDGEVVVTGELVGSRLGIPVDTTAAVVGDPLGASEGAIDGITEVSAKDALDGGDVMNSVVGNSVGISELV